MSSKYEISKELRLLIQFISLIAMVLVVYVHVPIDPTLSESGAWIEKNIRTGLCFFGVPIFFSISGFVFAHHIFEPQWWKKEIIKRIKSIFVPFLLFNAIFFPFVFTCNQIGSAYFGANEVFKWDVVTFVSGFGFNPFAMPGFVPTWFLRSLFILFLLSPVFALIIKCGRVVTFVALVILKLLAYYVVKIDNQAWHFFFGNTLCVNGAFCIFLGMALRIYFIDGLNRLAGRISLPKAVGNLAKNIMMVYLIHPIIMFCIHILFRVFHIEWFYSTSIAYIPTGIFLIISSYAVSIFLRNNAPKFVSLFFGGR